MEEENKRRTIRIPLSLKANFLRDPENFIRDIAAVSTESVNPFIRRKAKIIEWEERSKSLINPFDEDALIFDEDFISDNSFNRYMHIDLGVVKDAVGISMCHVPYFSDRETIVSGPDGVETRIDRVPFISFDFVGRIKANKGEEIVLSEIRQIIYEITNLGFYLDLITYDGFQSVESIQTLRLQGYRAARLSIDRTSTKVISVKQRDDRQGKSNYGIRRESTDGNILAAWEGLKELIYDSRIDTPYHPMLFKEARGLQEDRKKMKVDHPPKGSSDLIQSIAGSAFNAINNEQEGVLHDADSYTEKTGDSFYAGVRPSKAIDLNKDAVEDWQDDFDPDDREYLY